ncbi:tRNA threonylcarbamoyladenosine biosynthesis protein TsaB [Anatilimnocola aggregata]|uniref:tRNA threonylcarbamoyladenosine biosynthesis protein TsaB n=1 Tax=Anatilimnocola aggregata TaxID=2528021 RepID=A0A517YC47_9BACT|nr:tRNA (adenosine(37)-N6)-threonylcarbamoyltransferase complex dimerization subunit type 1 TsaB [Anatilimnocola aggregata]QDU27791.1 tRNA threonylcarbamoyladenosine biosynthesis protein TsaB [Anatilimnocola aggregata]
MTVWTLALETVATAGSVALLQGTEVVAEQQLPADSRSARTLATAINQLWQGAGKPPIHLVAVASGPGSFTGLRVGITTAKTLAFAWGARLIGVNTLTAIAFQAKTEDLALHVVLDAQRKELFLATLQRVTPQAQWERQGTDIIVTATDWLQSLTANPVSSVAVSGPALNKLRESLPAGTSVVDPQHWHPQAATIGLLALQAFAANQPDELWTLAPHYMRVSYAEEKKPAAKAIDA